jgi:MoaA/NifB/PqqE/SkfB family radical SAM enzyme
MIVRPQPTKRFMVDVGHHCNMNCKFCYHHHEGDLRKAKFKDHDEIIKIIGNGIARENTWCDFTGGEPTIHPDICSFVSLLKSQNIGSTIITNGVMPLITIDKLLDAGLNEFLISIHGLEDTHDKLTTHGARHAQETFLKLIRGKIDIRFNFVINQFNQNEIIETVSWMLQWDPKIINFINFNPHHGWKNDLKNAEEIVAGLYIAETQLNASIKLLEENNVGVNLRYYPMCRIAEKNRKYVCNDLQVVFDPYEWDYDLPIKTNECFLQWAVNATKSTEYKMFPCKDCNLQWICGGINKHFLEVVGDQIVTPQKINFENYEDRFYFYYYRQHAIKELSHKSIEG